MPSGKGTLSAVMRRRVTAVLKDMPDEADCDVDRVVSMLIARHREYGRLSPVRKLARLRSGARRLTRCSAASRHRPF